MRIPMHTTHRFLFITAIVLSLNLPAHGADQNADALDSPQRDAAMIAWFALQTDLVQNDLKLNAEQRRRLEEVQTYFENVVRDLGRRHIMLTRKERPRAN